MHIVQMIINVLRSYLNPFHLTVSHFFELFHGISRLITSVFFLKVAVHFKYIGLAACEAAFHAVETFLVMAQHHIVFTGEAHRAAKCHLFFFMLRHVATFFPLQTFPDSDNV